MRQSRTKTIYANDMLFVDIYTTWEEKPALKKQDTLAHTRTLNEHERFKWIGTEPNRSEMCGCGIHTCMKSIFIHMNLINFCEWMNEWAVCVCLYCSWNACYSYFLFWHFFFFFCSFEHRWNCNAMKSIQLKFYSVTAAMAFTQSTCYNLYLVVRRHTVNFSRYHFK